MYCARRIQLRTHFTIMAGFAAAAFSTLFLACDDDADGGNDTDTTDGTEDCEGYANEIVLDVGYNYTFSSEVDIQVYDIQGYPNVPTINWEGVTKDILGHDVDAIEDIGHVDLILWKLDNYEAFEEWMNTDNLDMEKLVVPVNVRSEIMAQKTGESSLETNDDIFPPESAGIVRVQEFAVCLPIGEGAAV